MKNAISLLHFHLFNTGLPWKKSNSGFYKEFSESRGNDVMINPFDSTPFIILIGGIWICNKFYDPHFLIIIIINGNYFLGNDDQPHSAQIVADKARQCPQAFASSLSSG